MEYLNTITDNGLLKELEQNKTKRRQVREAPMEWVQKFISKNGQKNCLFVTLTSNRDHSINYIKKSLDDWLNNICSRIFRCGKDKLIDKNCIHLLAFIELNEKGFYHYHLVIYINSMYKDYFKRLCNLFWKKRVCDGTTDIQDISDPVGLSKYVTKDYYKEESKDYFYCF